MTSVQKVITKTQRWLREGNWFSSLFDKTKFIPDATLQTAKLQKIETRVVETPALDTYDLVFNVQMPSLVNTRFVKYARDKDNVDYYCNNKIHVRLYFNDPNIFDTLTETSCIITPPIFRSNVTSKTEGMYLSTLSDIRKSVDDAIEEAMTERNDKDEGSRTGPFAESDKKISKENIAVKLGKSKYLDKLIEYVSDRIKPGTGTSPFKVYDTRYDSKDPNQTGFVSKTNFMNTSTEKKFFDKDYPHYVQFDFNLNEYTVIRDRKTLKITGLKKKTSPGSPSPGSPSPGSPALDDANESIILLLKKNQWFNILFHNITIPFDIKKIPKDMIRIEIEIENVTPSDSIGDVNIFYRQFFCEFLNMRLRHDNLSSIKIHDVVFQYDDMIRAISQRSPKFFNKIAQLNFLARKVIHYYLKSINDNENNRYTTTCETMKTAIQAAKTSSKKIVDGISVAKKEDLTQLKNSVTAANAEIKQFSSFFRRGNIKIFRHKFLQSLMRVNGKTGLSLIKDNEISEELAKRQNFLDIAKSGTAPKDVSTEIAATNIANSAPGFSGGNIGGDNGGNIGGDNGDVSHQTGGGGSGLFQSEDYNLMIPMDIHEPGTGINDMVVRIHKIHLLQQGGDETQKLDDETGVDIQVGDAVRFVYYGNVIYAIVCGFKPGKDLNKDGSDKQMNITDFRETYRSIIKTLESSDLTKTPEEYLSLTNMRGIKFLPFKYNDENYSYVPYDAQSSVTKTLNPNVKRGLNGKFVFSCKDKKIPILPNGYKLPFVSRVKENITTTLNKLNPFSTEADIGNDNTLPQYSLPSYMTLEKVFVPPNFSEVIKLIKDFRGNNPDEIFEAIKKIMQKSGLNESNDCEKTSDKVAASDFANRKKDYQEQLKAIRDAFNTNYVKNGKIINRPGAIRFIKNLYNQQVKPGIFVDSNGNPLRIATKLTFALYLIPNNPKLNMELLLESLSQGDVLSISSRKSTLSQQILTSELGNIKARDSDNLLDNVGGSIQYGGAEDMEKAEDIIKDTINLLYSQGFIVEKEKDMNIANLENTKATYDPTQNVATSASSTGMVKSGLGNRFGLGAGTGTGFGANFLSNLFKGSSGTSSSVRIGNDSCGNNTNIVCNGEDLVITVTLKLNELISSCMNPDMIQHWEGTHGPHLLENGNNDTTDIVSSSVDNAPAAPAAPPPRAAVVPDAEAQAAAEAKAAAESKAAAEAQAAAEAKAAAESKAAAEAKAAAESKAAAEAKAAVEAKAAAEDKAAAESKAAAEAQAAAKTKAAAESKAAAAKPTDINALIAQTRELYEKLDTLGKSIKETMKENFKNIDDAIEEGIMPSENNEKILTDLKPIVESKSKDPPTIKKSIETTYKVEIDRIKSQIKKMYDKLLNDYFKTCEEIKQTMDNISGNLEQIDPATKTSSQEDKSKTQITDLKTQQDEAAKKFKKQIEFATTVLNVGEYINDANIKDDIIVAIINFLERTEQAQSGDSQLYEALQRVPQSTLYKELTELTRVEDDESVSGASGESRQFLLGGRKNNSKSKKNKKSNKNKTKKRKSSTNRKFKFYKVKNILL